MNCFIIIYTINIIYYKMNTEQVIYKTIRVKTNKNKMVKQIKKEQLLQEDCWKLSTMELLNNQKVVLKCDIYQK